MEDSSSSSSAASSSSSSSSSCAVYHSAIALPPSCNHTKHLHFVRHAQGHHNVAGEKEYSGYLLEEHADASLTDFGISQCEGLNRKNKSLKMAHRSQLLVVSPMSRTLQTANHSFPDLIGSIPWIALESLREQTGLHPCDRRAPIGAYTALPSFSHVDFTNIESESDPFYHLYPDAREPSEQVNARCLEFLSWIEKRDEREIIVVTHSAYLRHLTKLLCGEERHFENCELVSLVVPFSSP